MPNNDFFSINLDISELLDKYEELGDVIEKKAQEKAALLAMQTHAHIVEQVQSKLHARRDIYLQNLSPPDEVDVNVWEIKLKEDATWIEDGLQSGFDMLPGLLASPKAKNGKNGKYIVVPFKHNKAPNKQTDIQRILNSAVRQEMQQRGIPYGNIEKDSNGQPKLGLLHKFNTTKPDQKWKLVPGQYGAEGRQFHANKLQPGHNGPQGRPYLWGVRIYQREVQNLQGGKSVQKDIMTFRTASESQAGRMWKHPGLEAMHFFEEAFTWAEHEADKMIEEILKEIEDL